MGVLDSGGSQYWQAGAGGAIGIGHSCADFIGWSLDGVLLFPLHIARENAFEQG
jgi:hypothetical protein